MPFLNRSAPPCSYSDTILSLITLNWTELDRVWKTEFLIITSLQKIPQDFQNFQGLMKDFQGPLSLSRTFKDFQGPWICNLQIQALSRMRGSYGKKRVQFSLGLQKSHPIQFSSISMMWMLFNKNHLMRPAQCGTHMQIVRNWYHFHGSLQSHQPNAHALQQATLPWYNRVLTNLAKWNSLSFPDPLISLFQTIIKWKPDVTNHFSSQFGSFLAESI